MYCFKWDGMWINTEYLKDITHPQKSSLEYTVTRLVGQDKALRKEATKTITTKKWYFDPTSGEVEKNWIH